MAKSKKLNSKKSLSSILFSEMLDELRAFLRKPPSNEQYIIETLEGALVGLKVVTRESVKNALNCNDAKLKTDIAKAKALKSKKKGTGIANT